MGQGLHAAASFNELDDPEHPIERVSPTAGTRLQPFNNSAIKRPAASVRDQIFVFVNVSVASAAAHASGGCYT